MRKLEIRQRAQKDYELSRMSDDEYRGKEEKQAGREAREYMCWGCERFGKERQY